MPIFESKEATYSSLFAYCYLMCVTFIINIQKEIVVSILDFYFWLVPKESYTRYEKRKGAC